MEMEKVRQQAEKDECESGDVQSVVAQHVSEIDALELHWRTEIEQLKDCALCSHEPAGCLRRLALVLV